VDVLADGALVIRTERGSRVAVPPQNLGLLEDPAGSPEVPADISVHLKR
jgi:BirA family biotin operon repressor/biotin-[acetyl-CoA-carboxylase] ligase